MIFTYQARDGAGKRVTGAMEAPSKTELMEKLRKMGFMATKVTETKTGVNIQSIFERFRRIKSDDMLIFYIQLSNMITAGIPIMMSLSTLAKQADNKRLAGMIGNVARQVESGMSLSQAFASYPNTFPRLFVNMIRAGEASGNLDAVLMRYAGFFERQEDLKEKVKGALFYPMILMTAGISVMILIVTFVIPQFAELYMKAGIRLPTPTLIVYNAGLVVKHYWYLLIVGFAAAAVGIKFYASTKKGAYLVDMMKLRLPIIGPLYKKVTIARFSRTLSTLLSSGVPILESLDITREVAGNEVLAQAIINIRTYVEKGERMAEPMRVSEEFPPDVIQMVSVGEETGNLDDMLNKIADFYDMTVNYAVKKLTTVIEPIFLVILGGMVGLIMASMLMPIFDMVKTIRH
ncbi:MAG: type II secretion system F family protein [Candidatus Omnitrophica bacterium]|nr:type II secretion system F family protein [Candidatus Omnitrophota bacterium]